jgi:hypothetical protein
MVTMMDACMGSWKCGKGGVFPTFPQPMYLFLKHKLPEKITMKRGENDFKCTNHIYVPVMRSFSSKLLTLTRKGRGEKKNDGM